MTPVGSRTTSTIAKANGTLRENPKWANIQGGIIVCGYITYVTAVTNHFPPVR
jgi:hypothetical protein